MGAAFCLVASQAAIAPSVGGLLRRSLERQAAEYRSLEVRMAPLGWIDLLRGRVRHVEVEAGGISFGGPRLARLEMRLGQIRLATGPLFMRGEAVVTGLGASRVLARVEAAALNEYRRRAYPAVPAFFQIKGGQVGLIGSLRLFGRDVSLRTSGRLQAEPGGLRFVPAAIEVAGNSVPLELLSSYGQNLSLEIPLVLPLPLVLREARLGEGYLDLIWTEITGSTKWPQRDRDRDFWKKR